MEAAFAIMRTLEQLPTAYGSNQNLNANVDLASLPPDELRTIVAILARHSGSTGAGNPGAVPEVLPRLHPELLGDDGSGSAVHPGLGDGGDHGTPSGR